MRKKIWDRVRKIEVNKNQERGSKIQNQLKYHDKMSEDQQWENQQKHTDHSGSVH